MNDYIDNKMNDYIDNKMSNYDAYLDLFIWILLIILISYISCKIMTYNWLVKKVVILVLQKGIKELADKKSVRNYAFKLINTVFLSRRSMENKLQKFLKIYNKHSFLIYPSQPNNNNKSKIDKHKQPKIKETINSMNIKIPSILDRKDSHVISTALINAKKKKLKIVIDLKQNRGGNMNIMFHSLLPILPPGLPIVAITRSKKSNEILYGIQGKRIHFINKLPNDDVKVDLSDIDILISSKTASSAEIVALALQTYGAKIIGDNSAGYMTVNENFIITEPDSNNKYILVLTTGYICDIKTGKIQTRISQTNNK
jgi:hypothetical protein